MPTGYFMEQRQGEPKERNDGMDFSLTDEQPLPDSVDELMERYGTVVHQGAGTRRPRGPRVHRRAAGERLPDAGRRREVRRHPGDVTTLMLVSERICKNGAPIYVYGNLCALMT